MLRILCYMQVSTAAQLLQQSSSAKVPFQPICNLRSALEERLRTAYCSKTFYRTVYWPPPPDKRSPLINLPSGKKCFVFNAKRDQDGKPETVLCFLDSEYKRLMWLNEEEMLEFEKLMPRLESYFKLWESKAAVELAASERKEAIEQVMAGDPD